MLLPPKDLQPSALLHLKDATLSEPLGTATQLKILPKDKPIGVTILVKDKEKFTKLKHQVEQALRDDYDRQEYQNLLKLYLERADNDLPTTPYRFFRERSESKDSNETSSISSDALDTPSYRENKDNSNPDNGLLSLSGNSNITFELSQDFQPMEPSKPPPSQFQVVDLDLKFEQIKNRIDVHLKKVDEILTCERGRYMLSLKISNSFTDLKITSLELFKNLQAIVNEIISTPVKKLRSLDVCANIINNIHGMFQFTKLDCIEYAARVLYLFSHFSRLVEYESSLISMQAVSSPAVLRRGLIYAPRTSSLSPSSRLETEKQPSPSHLRREVNLSPTQMKNTSSPTSPRARSISPPSKKMERINLSLERMIFDTSKSSATTTESRICRICEDDIPANQIRDHLHCCEIITKPESRIGSLENQMQYLTNCLKEFKIEKTTNSPRPVTSRPIGTITHSNSREHLIQRKPKSIHKLSHRRVHSTDFGINTHLIKQGMFFLACFELSYIDTVD